jgi:hypothetical protein
MKSRALPDDFDMAQALHSPYGSNVGLGTSIAPPVDFSATVADHAFMRPLMVDTLRRPEDDHMSHTGISPAFGNLGFTPSGTSGTSDLLSPLSSSGDRFYTNYLGNPLNPSGAGGPRNANPFARSPVHTESYPPPGQSHVRPLQFDKLSRKRSESLHSPLRSSMSWKGNSLDYGDYGFGSILSPAMGTSNRPPGLYTDDAPRSNPGSVTHAYDATSYTSAFSS